MLTHRDSHLSWGGLTVLQKGRLGLGTVGSPSTPYGDEWVLHVRTRVLPRQWLVTVHMVSDTLRAISPALSMTLLQRNGDAPHHCHGHAGYNCCSRQNNSSWRPLSLWPLWVCPLHSNGNFTNLIMVSLKNGEIFSDCGCSQRNHEKEARRGKQKSWGGGG